jgi:hypothetical protein
MARLAIDVARRLEAPTSPISDRRGSKIWAVNHSLTLVGAESPQNHCLIGEKARACTEHTGTSGCGGVGRRLDGGLLEKVRCQSNILASRFRIADGASGLAE